MIVPIVIIVVVLVCTPFLIRWLRRYKKNRPFRAIAKLTSLEEIEAREKALDARFQSLEQEISHHNQLGVSLGTLGWNPVLEGAGPFEEELASLKKEHQAVKEQRAKLGFPAHIGLQEYCSEELMETTHTLTLQAIAALKTVESVAERMKVWKQNDDILTRHTKLNPHMNIPADFLKRLEELKHALEKQQNVLTAK